MNRFLAAVGVLGLVVQTAWAAGELPIDRETLHRWSAPYRGWHYWPEPVIPAEPKIPGHEAFHNTDVPCVYQLPGQPDKWYMSFIAFNGQGYNSFVAESDDLVRWRRPRLAMGFGRPGEFDHGGCVIGAFLYDSYDVRAARVLNRRDGKFWTLYGCYPRQGGYELRPGYQGVATSDDGLVWRRAKDQPTLSVSDADCGTWEKSCIYQPWLVEHEGRYYDFYNAAQGGTEQTGVAFSTDLLTWRRHSGNPVVRVRPNGYDEQFASDPKVFRDGDHWVMLYFGVGRGGAHVLAAFSRDLLHWTAHPEPLYRAGGHPGGLDKTYAHKISLVHHPKHETFYLYYCAVGSKGRCIGLITSKRLAVDTGPSARPAIPSVKALADQVPCTVDYFDVAGHCAFLIRPKRTTDLSPMPWVWYAPVIGHPNPSHAWMLRQWLEKGIGMAGVDVGESFGSPAGRKVFTALWEALTSRYGMSKRPCLLLQSRGGLMLYNWAAENPSRVGCIAGIYTVCDLRSYPGIDRACGAYGLSAAELETRLAEHNPIERLAPLAKAGVPIFHIHGDADSVVPLERNAGELARRYRALGGQVRLVVVPGKGHQVCDEFFHCQELVDFIVAHTRPKSQPTAEPRK